MLKQKIFLLRELAFLAIFVIPNVFCMELQQTDNKTQMFGVEGCEDSKTFSISFECNNNLIKKFICIPNETYGVNRILFDQKSKRIYLETKLFNNIIEEIKAKENNCDATKIKMSLPLNNNRRFIGKTDKVQFYNLQSFEQLALAQGDNTSKMGKKLKNVAHHVSYGCRVAVWGALIVPVIIGSIATGSVGYEIFSEKILPENEWD